MTCMYSHFLYEYMPFLKDFKKYVILIASEIYTFLLE